MSYGAVYDGDKFSDNMVYLIKTSEDSDDIGTWIGVLLSQDTT
jgi:hypothetical protein